MRRWAWESPDGSEGRKPRRGGQQCTARFVGASGHVLTVARRHKRCRFDPWVGKIPWRRAWQPTPVFLPGESPWTKRPGGLQFMGSQRVGHN